MGDAFVESLAGDYDNVVGLPVKCVRRLIERFTSPEHVVSITDIALPHDWGVEQVDGGVIFIAPRESFSGDEDHSAVDPAQAASRAARRYR